MKITMLEFSSDKDYTEAKRIALLQGYADSCAYTMSSDIPGLYLLPRHTGQANKVIVKTEEFGFAIIEIVEG